MNAETENLSDDRPAASNYTLRPADESRDAKFLSSLYASTRDDLKMIGLPAEQFEMLVAMQHRAQDQYYRATYPEATHRIVCVGETSIGRLIVERSGSQLLLVDVALLPEFRGHGIGGAILRDLIDEAVGSGRVMVLQVVKTNPAVNLYRRLGGEITGDTGTHYQIEWRPPV